MAIAELPVRLDGNAVLEQLVVGEAVHLHGIHPDAIFHVLVVLLHVSVRTQPHEVLRDVLRLEEHRTLRALPLGHIHREIVIARRLHVLQPRLEVEIVVLEREARAGVGREVVCHIPLHRTRRERRVVDVALCRMEVFCVFDARGEAVRPAARTPVDGTVERLAGIRRVHAGRDFAFKGLRAALFCDDVDGAADRIRAVEHGGRPLNHFNALDHRRIDQNGRARHGLVLRNTLPVDHDDRAEGVFAANLNALHALTAVIHDANARNILQEVAHGLRVRALDVLLRNHRDRHRHV